MARGLKFSIFSVVAPILPFLTGLAIVLVVAAFVPNLGAQGGPLRTEWFTEPAVALIFLIQGFLLPLDQMRRGLLAWRVHTFVQCWMFVASPLLALAIVLVMQPVLEPIQQVGLLYLGLVPTTVATNAAFTAKAGGNTAVALFNIVLGNLLGLFICPALLVFLLTHGSPIRVSPWPLMGSLFWQILLPFCVGQLLRSLAWAAAHAHRLREVSSALILFIVYVSMSNLFAGNNGTFSWRDSAAISVCTILLLLFNKSACWLVLHGMPWPYDQKIAAFFAASQKSLVAGLPIAGAVYVASGPQLAPFAMLVLPLIIYHIAQLIVGSVLIPLLQKPLVA